MNEYLKKLTPLDSSQLEVFLGIFFIFLKFKFEVLMKPASTGTGPETAVTRKKNPAVNTCWPRAL